MKMNARQIIVAVGLSFAAVSAEAGFGDLLKAVTDPGTNQQQEPAKAQEPEKAKDATNACPKCNGTGSVSRGLKTRKCKTCGGTGAIQKKAASASSDEQPAAEEAEESANVKSSNAAAEEAAVVFDDISAEELKVILKKKTGYLLLDVREPDEFASGHIAGAINIPVGQVSQKIRSVCGDKAKDIYVYCQSGKRSRMAAQRLLRMDYKRIHNVIGGINSWNGKLVK